MNRIFRPAPFAVAALLAGAPAHALNYTSYVSFNGSDANGCYNPGAACFSIDVALSQTLSGGEIWVLDDNFTLGATITKSVTINFGGHTLATGPGSGSVFTVAAGANDVVILRGLSLNGMNKTGNPAVKGITFTSGKALHLDNSKIFGFSNAGIDFAPTAASTLQMNDSQATDNGAAGIWIRPATGGSARVTLTNVIASRNNHGLHVQGSASVSISDSTFSENAGVGVYASGLIGSLTLERTVAARNGNGVVASGSGASVFLSQTSLFLNVSRGINALNASQIVSFGNNRFAGNPTEGTFTSTLTEK